MIDLSDLPARAGAVWDRLLDLDALRPSGWVLVGAQMVILRGMRHGRQLDRATADADVVVDVRLVEDGAADMARLLLGKGFDLEGISAMGIGHRFSDGLVAIDVLAPDGPFRNKRRLTTIAPARTVSVPGGNQALRRLERVQIRRGDRTGHVPCPGLLGAILVKARAVDVDDVPESQRADLAFLCSLVPDPRALIPDFVGKERGWLKRRQELLDPKHPAWGRLDAKYAEEGHLAFRILSGLSG